ncbi:MAG: fumarylacetoacetate hydrolase family protein [Candidatus Thermoplasmatota archaeon]|nr:fumarylacetoacetate hydrolase family protein [Candidatus Thermoplasmatota archaeon]
MRLVKFVAEGDVGKEAEKERWGIIEGSVIKEIESPLSAKETGEVFERYRTKAPFFGTKIICLGLNYESHVEENRTKKPEKPVLFSKAVSSVVGSGDHVIRPQIVNNLDYEVELAFVIGKKASNASKSSAYSHVLGYTVLNDVSARDLQFSDKQWFRGKSCDTFCPLGPCIVDKEEIDDPMDLEVEMRVNGEVKQRANTKEMISDIPFILEYISQTMTLLPGDVIATGTPAGVGAFRDPPEFLHDGDLMEAEIEKIGILRNSVFYTSTQASK